MGFHAGERRPALPGVLGNCLVSLAWPTVVLCHSGSRSALATQQLQKNRLTWVANLRGGIRAWKAKGLPLEHPSAKSHGAMTLRQR